MKKVYLLVSGLLLTAGAVNAQTVTEKAYLPVDKSVNEHRMSGYAADREPGAVIVSDDFSVEGNWMIYTDGGTTPEWEITTSTPENVSDYMFGGDEWNSPTRANGFGVFDGISYLLDGPVVPVDALIEYDADINCSGATAVTLEFYFGYRAFNSDQVFVEVTNNDWVSFESYELYADMATNASTIEEINLVDITTVAAGESAVRVRFRFTETGADPAFGCGYGALVDDFKVKEAWDYDQKITASYHRSGLGISNLHGLEYYQIPESQITEINFAGQHSNLGGLVQPNAKLNVEVTGAGSYSGTSTPADLPVSGSDSVACTTTFTPSAVGTYDVVYFFDCDEAEEETINDTLYDSFMVTSVTEPVYARDNGISSSSIGNVTSNTGNPLLIGNTMDIFADAVIGAVDIVVTTDATNVDQLIFAQIMVFDEGAGAYVYLDQTDDHVITSGENGGIIRLFFENDIEVYEGQTIMVLAGHYGGTDEVRFRMAQGTDEQTVLGYTSGATDPFYLTAPSAIMVRPVLRSFIGIEDAVANNFAIGQNMPNPFNATSVINYELNEAANVSIEIVDVTGKVVKSINKGTQGAGEYTLNLDATDFAEGVYYYTFTVGAEQLTKSMVITK